MRDDYHAQALEVKVANGRPTCMMGPALAIRVARRQIYKLMAHDDSLTIGTVINDRYEVDAHLGAGGYSEVVAATDVECQRQVALKILRAEATDTDPRAVARLRQEAEILRAVEHPHIVEFFEVDTFDGGQFLVMEYVDGTGLDELLAREAPFDTERLLPMVRQLLDALRAAHDTEILHRDLKPENIIVTDAGTAESIKLVDFGVAKANALLNTDDPDEGVTLVQTQAGNFVGTPRYAAPEMIVGDPLAANSDLFGLGVVVYEALTATPLIHGQSQSELMNQLVFPRPFDLSDVPDPWPEWLAPVLEKSPEHRLATAEEARRLLDDVFGAPEETSATTADADVSDDGPEIHPVFSDDGADAQLEPTREVDSPHLADEAYAPTVERPSLSTNEIDHGGDDENADDDRSAVSSPPPVDTETPNGDDAASSFNTVLTFLLLAVLAFVLGSLFLGLR